MGDVGEGMRASAARYLSSVKLAMARIQLLAAPSLVLLQSLLCSSASTPMYELHVRHTLTSCTNILVHRARFRGSNTLLDFHHSCV